MADDRDDSQATEQPTQKRLEQARESGDVVKSTEVNAFVLLAGGTLAIAMFGRSAAVGMGQFLTIFIAQPEQMSVDGAGLSAMLRGTLVQLAMTLAPFAGVMMAAALAGHLLQNLPTLTPEKLIPDFSKLSPMAGFKRLFGFEGWMNLLKGLAKMAVVAMAIWTQLWPERGMLEGILTESAVSVVGDMSHLLFKVLPAI
jgi:flagellar biosynthetic protein FlhB